MNRSMLLKAGAALFSLTVVGFGLFAYNVETEDEVRLKKREELIEYLIHRYYILKALGARFEPNCPKEDFLVSDMDIFINRRFVGVTDEALLELKAVLDRIFLYGIRNRQT